MLNDLLEFITGLVIVLIVGGLIIVVTTQLCQCV